MHPPMHTMANFCFALFGVANATDAAEAPSDSYLNEVALVDLLVFDRKRGMGILSDNPALKLNLTVIGDVHDYLGNDSRFFRT